MTVFFGCRDRSFCFFSSDGYDAPRSVNMIEKRHHSWRERSPHGILRCLLDRADRIRFPQDDRIAAVPSTFRPQTAFFKQQKPLSGGIGREKQETSVGKSAAAREAQDIPGNLHFSVKAKKDKLSFCKGSGRLCHSVGETTAREIAKWIRHSPQCLCAAAGGKIGKLPQCDGNGIHRITSFPHNREIAWKRTGIPFLPR